MESPGGQTTTKTIDQRATDVSRATTAKYRTRRHRRSIAAMCGCRVVSRRYPGTRRLAYPPGEKKASVVGGENETMLCGNAHLDVNINIRPL